MGHRLTLDDLQRDFHGSLAGLRSTEPVSWVPALGGWLVTAREFVVAILRDPVGFTVDDPRFSTQRVIGPSMLSLDGPEHSRHRGPFEQAFRRGDPALLRARMTDTASALIRTFADDRAEANGLPFQKPSVDLRTQLAAPLAVTVMVDALGLVDVEPDALLRWYGAIVGDVSRTSLGEQPSEAGFAAMELLRAAVARSVSESELLQQASGALTLDEIVSNVAVLLFGGVETSEAMTANAFVHLLSDPDVYSAASADLSLVPAFVDESTRIEPAAAQLDRYATTNVTLGQAEIKAGDFVICSVAGANRDPSLFDDPNRFDTARPNAKANVSFAQGPHACLATHVAKAQTEAAVRCVLTQLRNIRLDPSAAVPLIEGIVFRKASSVWVSWD